MFKEVSSQESSKEFEDMIENQSDDEKDRDLSYFDTRRGESKSGLTQGLEERNTPKPSTLLKKSIMSQIP